MTDKTNLCVCVQHRTREWGTAKTDKTESQDGDMCVLSHTLFYTFLLFCCCFVVIQSNVIKHKKTNILTSHLTSRDVVES